jgi:uncharacterized protein with LGFP repeats
MRTAATIPETSADQSLVVPTELTDAVYQVFPLNAAGGRVGWTVPDSLDSAIGYWARTAAVAAQLGAPTSQPYQVGSVWVRDFANGKIILRGDLGTGSSYPLYGVIADAYPAAPSGIGFPLVDQAVAGDAHYQVFEHGVLVVSPSTGTHTVYGAISSEYVRAGGPAGVLGLPLTNELATPDGVGRYTHFEHGSIYWTPQTGAHEVHGAIRDRWAAQGWERGPLGYPTSGERGGPDGAVRANDFQGGEIVWTAQYWTHVLHGAILAYWRDTVINSRVGPPVTDELGTPDGVGRYQHFAWGSIYWTPATGAQEIHGAIRDKWAAQGWERGPLGYPTSWENDTNPYGTGMYGDGRYSRFQNGQIVWSPATGAHIMPGWFGSWPPYKSTEALGEPVTDVLWAPDGRGRYMLFQYGAMYSPPSDAAYPTAGFPVSGAFWLKYQALGYERGCMGYPLSSEYVSASGIVEQTYEHGRMDWYAATGKAVAACNGKTY